MGGALPPIRYRTVTSPMPPSANCRDHIRIKATLRHDLTAPPSAEKVAPVGLYQSESFMGQHDAAGMVPTIILLCIELGCIGNVLSTCRHWLACLHYEKQVRMAYYRAMLLRPFWDDVNTRIGKVGESVDEDWGRCPERVSWEGPHERLDRPTCGGGNSVRVYFIADAARSLGFATKVSAYHRKVSVEVRYSSEEQNAAGIFTIMPTCECTGCCTKECRRDAPNITGNCYPNCESRPWDTDDEDEGENEWVLQLYTGPRDPHRGGSACGQLTIKESFGKGYHAQIKYHGRKADLGGPALVGRSGNLTTRMSRTMVQILGKDDKTICALHRPTLAESACERPYLSYSIREQARDRALPPALHFVSEDVYLKSL